MAIKLVIKATTDFDFGIGFPQIIKSQDYTIQRSDDVYNVQVIFDNKLAKINIVSFLSQIVINDFKKNGSERMFVENMNQYIFDIGQKGLHSCKKDLMSGNWSISVDLFEVNEKWLE